jgi:hypothetical protein
MAETTTDVHLGLRVPRELHETIKRIADREQRSVSGQVRVWLDAAVAAESRKGEP